MNEKLQNYVNLVTEEDKEYRLFMGSQISDAMCGIIRAKHEVSSKQEEKLLDIALEVIGEFHYLLSIM